MTLLVVLCTLAAYAKAKPLGYAIAPLPPPYYAPLPYAAAPYPYSAASVVAAPNGAKAQYYAQDYAGRVSYGFADPTQTQSVIQDAAGNKVGSFSFINAEGKLVQANYIADSLGYQAGGSSNQQQQQSTAPQQEEPKPAEEAPEVAEAKAKFFADYKKFRNSHEASPEQSPATTSKSSEPIAPPISEPIAPPISEPIAPPISIPYSPITYVSHVPLPYPPQLPYPYGYPVHYPIPFVISSQ